MVRWLVGASTRLWPLVAAAAAGVVALGIFQVGRTPVDVLPEFSPPIVEIQSEALGLSAAEVEQLMTVPMEQDLLVGVAFLDQMESVSMPGLSSVVMTFEPDTDVLDARQLVQERLTQAAGIAGLPAVGKPPQMIQPLSSTGRVSMVTLTSDELSPIEMSVLARWVISPRLMGVPGVANVAIWGNRDRQLQVLVDPQRLQREDVSLSQVIRTAGNALEVSPLSYLEASTPGTGGFIDTPNQRLNIFHEQPITSASELAQVPLEGADGGNVSTNGQPLLLGDVADVVEDHQPLIGDAVCAGEQECLLLVIEKFPGTNAVEVSREIDDALDAMRPGLAGLTMDSSVYEPDSYIESAFENAGLALLIGAALLLLLIAVFTWDWRKTSIVAAAVAVATSIAIVVLNLLDTTVNLMVTAGLVVGLTAIVDEAVNDAYAVGRGRRAGESNASMAPAVAAAIWSTRRAAVYTALIVVAATVPLFVLDGAADAFLPPIALAYWLAIGASLLVAVIVTPVLSIALSPTKASESSEAPATRVLHRAYDRVAPRLVARSTAAIAALVVLAAAGLLALPLLNASMRPSVEERDVIVEVQAAPGTSLPKMTEDTQAAVAELGELPGVQSVTGQIGRASVSDRVVDVNSAQLWVKIDSDADYDATVSSIEDAVSDTSDWTTDVVTYSDERVTALLQEPEHDLAVRVYGADPDVLNDSAAEVSQALAGVEGVDSVTVDSPPKEPTIHVEVDLQRAQALGIKPGDVRRAAASMLGGITVGNLFQDQKVFDVVVWGTPSIRDSVDDLERMLIEAPQGVRVPLGDVANVEVVSDDALILHEAASRFVEVTADVSGRSVADVASDADAVIKDIDFPLDHHAEVVTDWSDQQDATTRVVAVGIAVAIAVFLLLQAAFRSWALALLAFVSIPAAVSGCLVGTLTADGTITLGVAAGLLGLLGVATRSVLLLIAHLQRLQHADGVPLGPDLVARGMRERLTPTVVSALAVAAVALPFAILGGATGLEVIRPAAVGILGGLVTTLLVSVLAVPAAYLRLAPQTLGDEGAAELTAAEPADLARA